MKKFGKIVIIVIVIILILGLLWPLLNLAAEEQKDLKSQIKEGVDSINASIDELIDIKDSELSNDEKIQKEIHIRKDAILKIINLSFLEIDNLKEKLESLNLNTEEKNDLRKIFLDILDSNKEYSEQLQSKITEETTLENLKQLALEFQDWRKENYNETVKKILAFVMVYQEQDTLKIADARLEKIISDLKRLENAKLITREVSWDLLNTAIKYLANAHLFNNKAENILTTNLYDEFLSTSVIATTTTPILVTASTTSEITLSTPNVLSEKEISDIKALVEKSLVEIRNAYKKFIEISNKIRSKLNR